jgi:type IV pilus assembly protein PilY1
MYYKIPGLWSEVYTGDQLNSYFFYYNGSLSSLTNVTSTTSTRLATVQFAATAFVSSLIPESNELPIIRLGLTQYNNGNGGKLLSAISELDETKANSIIASINNIVTNGSTPLASTLSDIGHYFTSGLGQSTWTSLTGTADTSTLILYPGLASSPNPTVSNIFNNHNLYNSTGVTPLPSPIQGSCQKNAAILLTDGLPNDVDSSISSLLQNYDGEGTEPADDYLDDVAQALYKMDLRPTLSKINTEISNILTYTIGFADVTTSTSSLLPNTARQAGGQFIYATNITGVIDALDNFTSDIISKVSSSSSVTANSAQLDSGAAIYQGKYDSADWTGSLMMLPVGVSEDINGNGKLDAGEDTNRNGILDGGAIGTALWNAAEKIPAYGSRHIYTYNPTLTSVAKGIEFTCSNLSVAQRTILGFTNTTSTCSSSDHGVWLVNYIRGDWMHEEINPARTDTEVITSSHPSIRSTTITADRIYRNRTHLTKIIPFTGVIPDPWLLGDIVNSDPVYVGNEDYGYSVLGGTEGSSYKVFLTQKATRRKMIYVGSNDAMLHGFDANASGDGGKEIFAFIPNDVFGELKDLSSPSYNHQFSVDGAPRVADVYTSTGWRTVLVSTTASGGSAVFALDVTDPDAFSTAKVLWEISNIQSPTPTDQSTDTTAFRGFGNNMGYTLPQSSIVKMQDGSWAAIVANGYGSTNNLAVLYIIDALDGHVIKAFNTGVGGATTPNGLSTPIAVDTNNDKMVDVIYAGDLLGNLWKFDVGSYSNGSWTIANNGLPLFQATDSTSNQTPQPITAKPQVGAVGSTQSSGVMVYVGTGKYFETGDIVDTQNQTFYGIWDTNAVVSKTNLQVQSITSTVTSNGYNLRVTTDTAVDYSTKKGWYMDLSANTGERVTATPLLRNGKIIFVTLTPVAAGTNSSICDATSGATSWLMELDALTGKRLTTSTATGLGAPWDINNDGLINASDLITVNTSGVGAASGKQSKNGGNDTPGVITNGALEYKYTSGTSNGQIEVTTESAGGSGSGSSSTGSRQSWRQLFD